MAAPAALDPRGRVHTEWWADSAEPCKCVVESVKLKEHESEQKPSPAKLTHRDYIEREQRRFSIDLTPRVGGIFVARIFCVFKCRMQMIVARSATVDALIASRTSAYVEFKCVDRLIAAAEEVRERCVNAHTRVDNTYI